MHLARLAGRHIRILIPGDVEQRRYDAIGAQDRRVLEIPFRKLPTGPADAVLALLRRVRVAHAETQAVGVEADHVDFARDVDRRLEPICVIQERRVAAVARAMDAKPIRIGNTQIDQPIGRRRDSLDPRLTGPSDHEIDRWMKDDVAVIASNAARALKPLSKKVS